MPANFSRGKSRVDGRHFTRLSNSRNPNAPSLTSQLSVAPSHQQKFTSTSPTAPHTLISIDHHGRNVSSAITLQSSFFNNPHNLQPTTTTQKMEELQQANHLHRESFDGIYLDLSKESGKCRFAETGFGWKPSGGGDTFTLDASNIGGAQWSRAAKGYEVKILQRNSGVVQLDGFQQEVRISPSPSKACAKSF